jgi:multiple sugar transport system ATP-binding protein
MTLGDRVAVLKKGLLQQLASPRELYEQPVNLFVAGFIGSPPMNFLPAQVKGEKVELPFVTVDIPPQAREKAKDKGLLIAGIRPEYFEDAKLIDAAKAQKGQTFRATIDVVEWLGNEQYAYIPFEAPPEVEHQLADLEKEMDGEALRTQLVVSLDAAAKVFRGEEAELFIDASRMHLFDPSTGENLTLAASSDQPAGGNGAAGAAQPR